MMINACLIGAGRMGRDHAKHIVMSNDARLYCVVDKNLAVAKEVADKYGAKAYSSVEEALADPKVDAIIIASNTDTHADLIATAARAKKPIFCEKPIDLNIAKIDKCLKAVEENRVPLFIGFNRRFDPSFSSLKQRITQGLIGKVEMVLISSRDHTPPSREYARVSGGLFRDMMIHDFDMARWLLDEEPVQVFATGSCLVDPTLKEIGDVDTAMVILKTKSGSLCQINNSRRSAYGYDQRIEVFGSHGMLRAHNLAPTTVEHSNELGVKMDNPHPSFPQRYQEAYRLEMDHFFSDVVRLGRSPSISSKDGRQAIVIADAADESYRTGRPVAIV